MWSVCRSGDGHWSSQAALIAPESFLLAIFVWHYGRTPIPILPPDFRSHAATHPRFFRHSFLAFFSGVVGLSALFTTSLTMPLF